MVEGDVDHLEHPHRRQQGEHDLHAGDAIWRRSVGGSVTHRTVEFLRWPDSSTPACRSTTAAGNSSSAPSRSPPTPIQSCRWRRSRARRASRRRSSTTTSRASRTTSSPPFGRGGGDRAADGTDPDVPTQEALTRSLDAFLVDRGERDRLPQDDGERRERPRGEGSRRRDPVGDLSLHPRGHRRALPRPAAAPSRGGAWLWFMDGAILDWLDHRDMSKTEPASSCSAPSPGR